MFTTTYRRPVVHAPSRVPTAPALAPMHLQTVQPIPQPEIALMNSYAQNDLPRRPRSPRPDPAQARLSGGIGVVLLALLALLLTACGGGAGAADTEPDPTEPATTIVAQEAIETDEDSDSNEDAPSASDAAEICADDEFRVGELLAFDAAWEAALDDAVEPAQAWQPDAGLKRLSAMCWFGEELSWSIYHYSPEADAWFAFPENEEHPPLSLDAAVIDPEAISFADLRDWLHEAGYEDDDLLSSGVEVAPIATDLGGTDRAFAYTVTFGTTDLTTVRIDGATGEVLAD